MRSSKNDNDSSAEGDRSALQWIGWGMAAKGEGGREGLREGGGARARARARRGWDVGWSQRKVVAGRPGGVDRVSGREAQVLRTPGQGLSRFGVVFFCLAGDGAGW